MTPPADLGAALAAAARLFDAALFFEVHELLEPHWLVASGATRHALQGVIQIAVGWQHLANGNLAGARSLLSDGAERLHGQTLAGIDFDSFARAAVEAAAAIPTAAPPTFPRATR
jgi:predicted metal-dependent hydrolase